MARGAWGVRNAPPIRISAFCLTILLMSLAACATVTSNAAPINCTVAFEANVHHGPDAGLSLVGNLTLQVEPSGALSGVLTQQDSSQVQVSGQAQGQAINLVFDLGNKQHIFGVGSLQYDVRECKGAIGGPFTGPQPGDSGDWGYALGG